MCVVGLDVGVMERCLILNPSGYIDVYLGMGWCMFIV